MLDIETHQKFTRRCCDVRMFECGTGTPMFSYVLVPCFRAANRKIRHSCRRAFAMLSHQSNNGVTCSEKVWTKVILLHELTIIRPTLSSHAAANRLHTPLFDAIPRIEWKAIHFLTTPSCGYANCRNAAVRLFVRWHRFLGIWKKTQNKNTAHGTSHCSLWSLTTNEIVRTTSTKMNGIKTHIFFSHIYKPLKKTRVEHQTSLFYIHLLSEVV